MPVVLPDVTHAAALVGVDVWLLPLPPLLQPGDDSDGGAAAHGLDAHECARARRLRSAVLRRQFVAAHVLQRQLLARCTGLLPHQVPLAVGPSGKPLPIRQADGRLLHHNLSHSGDWLLLAVSLDGPVGVDIEQVQPRGLLVDLADLARLVFSAPELQHWQALPTEHRELAFHVGWTQKEAWLKAQGLGLGQAADGSVVSFRLGDAPVRTPVGRRGAEAVVSGRSWCVPGGAGRRALVATVVLPGRSGPIRVRAGRDPTRSPA